ncbi:MAG: hypothetical protein ABIQ31_23075 [Ferruginibacter sp.]
MKVYQYKRNEIFIIESYLNEERLADAYNELFNEILLSRNISEKEIFQSLNMFNNKITSVPHIVKALLFKETLPPFKFLVCKN